MSTIAIPDFGDLDLPHLVCDYDGTLALDGVLIASVARRLPLLAREITIHVLTADTFGLARQQLDGLPVKLTFLPYDDRSGVKLRYVEAPGAEKVIAIGNGRSDRQMLAAAALGKALIQDEGAAVEAILNADVVATCIQDAFDLLTHPNRLKATLHS